MTDLSGVVGEPFALVGSALGLADQAATYVVQPGETLTSIAAGQGVTVPALLDANPQILHADLVQPGDQISLPQSGSAQDGTGIAQGAAADVGVAVPAPAELAATPGPGSEALPLAGLAPPSVGQAGASLPTTVASAVLAQAAGAEQAQATDMPLAPPALLAGDAAVALDGPNRGDPPALTLLQAMALLEPDLAQLVSMTLAGGTRSIALAAISERLSIPLASLTENVENAAYLALTVEDRASAPSASLADTLGSQITPPGVDLPVERREIGFGVSSRQARAGRDAGRGAPAIPRSPQRLWIERALPAAQSVKTRWGVPIAVTLAHGALASDWGRMARNNDYFGLLETASCSASRALVPVPILAEHGRNGFDDLLDAADAFGAALRGDPRFARAFRVGDPGAFVTRLAETGAPRRYAEAMMSIIALNGLEAFDG